MPVREPEEGGRAPRAPSPPLPAAACRPAAAGAAARRAARQTAPAGRPCAPPGRGPLQSGQQSRADGEVDAAQTEAGRCGAGRQLLGRCQDCRAAPRALCQPSPGARTRGHGRGGRGVELREILQAAVRQQAAQVADAGRGVGDGGGAASWRPVGAGRVRWRGVHLQQQLLSGVHHGPEGGGHSLYGRRLQLAQRRGQRLGGGGGQPAQHAAHAAVHLLEWGYEGSMARRCSALRASTCAGLQRRPPRLAAPQQAPRACTCWGRATVCHAQAGWACAPCSPLRGRLPLPPTTTTHHQPAPTPHTCRQLHSEMLRSCAGLQAEPGDTARRSGPDAAMYSAFCAIMPRALPTVAATSRARRGEPAGTERHGAVRAAQRYHSAGRGNTPTAD